VAGKLLSFRQEQVGFINPSFATISSAGSNAAIIHYHPTEKLFAKIQKNLIFLCDSGGQYRDGTTDVTRSFHFGTPLEKEKLGYTLVLKGVINLSSLIFPANTNGLQIDALARVALWQFGLDYRHGTGHGIGHFLNVHEGPHSISWRPRSLEVPFRENMIVTNEPGYYEEGAFGVRIENMMAVKKVDTKFNFQDTGFMGFETLTFVPLDYKLIERSLLSPEELQWVNSYHHTCWEKLSPLLNDDFTLQWLKRYTSPL
jgi:Xaa-Pro aminopeptidase